MPGHGQRVVCIDCSLSPPIDGRALNRGQVPLDVAQNIVRTSRSRQSPDTDTWQVVEAEPFGRDDGSPGGDGRGGDDEIVGASRSTCCAYRHQELRMSSGNVEVVADDLHCPDDVVEKGPSRLSTFAGCSLDADPELGDCDGGHGGLVVVGDQSIEVEGRAFRIDEDARVEQQERQNRSSIARLSRRA